MMWLINSSNLKYLTKYFKFIKVYKTWTAAVLDRVNRLRSGLRRCIIQKKPFNLKYNSTYASLMIFKTSSEGFPLDMIKNRKLLENIGFLI